MNHVVKSLAVTCLSAVFLSACGGSDNKDTANTPSQVQSRNAALLWNEQLLEAVRSTTFPPPVVARMMSIVHTCMYDAWASYDDIAIPAHSTLPRRQADERSEAAKQAAVSHAAYYAVRDLLPESQWERFNTLMTDLGYTPDLDNDDTSQPNGVGNQACQAVLAFRHQDGANQKGEFGGAPYSDYASEGIDIYTPTNTPEQLIDPGRWQPLVYEAPDGTVTVQSFPVPHWGRVTPFVTDPSESYAIKTPAAVDTEAYTEQAQELIELSANLTDVEKAIAEYWIDGPRSETPPGHWNLLSHWVSERDQHNLDDDIKLFFALNNAVMDAGIWCWGTKREYDYVRPITAIAFLFQGQQIDAWGGPGQGTQTINGEDWSPYQKPASLSPPFPDYVSGHSTFSASGARILELFTGSETFGYTAVFAAGSSGVEPGLVPAEDVQLTWATFKEAADEAGFSRRLGGIHFEDADLEARRVGRIIGSEVWQRANNLFNGISDL